VERLVIVCVTCGKEWQSTVSSDYERQARESCPCPQCGAYSLSCREVAAVKGRGGRRRSGVRRIKAV